MNVQTEWVGYGSGFRGYLAKAHNTNTENTPAILVIQEVWGVDEHIQDVTRRFAEAGYIAFAPDLFSRNGATQEELKAERIREVKTFLDELPPSGWGNIEERNKALAKHPEEKQQRITDTLQTLFRGLKPTDFIGQLKEAADFLRQSYSLQLVGCVGFCLGGALSALLAANDPNLKAAVIFYGNAPTEKEMESINCPVLGFYGEKDKRITGQVADFSEKMKSLGKSYNYHIYQGAEHAFFNDTRRSYHQDAATDAFDKTLKFFNSELTKS